MQSESCVDVTYFGSPDIKLTTQLRTCHFWRRLRSGADKIALITETLQIVCIYVVRPI